MVFWLEPFFNGMVLPFLGYRGNWMAKQFQLLGRVFSDIRIIPRPSRLGRFPRPIRVVAYPKMVLATQGNQVGFVEFQVGPHGKGYDMMHI